MPPVPLPPGCWHRRRKQRNKKTRRAALSSFLLLIALRGVQGRQQAGIDALRVLPEPVRQVPGHGLGGGGQLQVQDAVHIVPQPQLHHIGAVFPGSDLALHLVSPQQAAVVFRHVLIRPQAHGVGEAGLADLAVFQPLGGDGVAALLRQAQVLRLHQIVQALGIGKVVDAVVAHGQLLHPLRRQRLRHPGGDIQDQKLDLQLVVNESGGHMHPILSSCFLYYTGNPRICTGFFPHHRRPAAIHWSEGRSQPLHYLMGGLFHA